MQDFERVKSANIDGFSGLKRANPGRFLKIIKLKIIKSKKAPEMEGLNGRNRGF